MASGIVQRGLTARPRAARQFTYRRYVLDRLGFAVLTLLLISIITFAATSATKSPREVAVGALGSEVSQQQLDLYIADHGLDDPLPVRYVAWLGDFVQGDWGTSLVTDRPVFGEVKPRLGNTALLAALAMLLAIPIGLATAVFMACRPGRLADVGLLAVTVVLAAIPDFVLGLGLLWLFGTKLQWLPLDSTALDYGTTSEKIQTFVLPVLTLALVSLPYCIRIGRSSAREALAAPYTQAALLRGLPRRTVLWDHAMRNAAGPILNALALSLIYLLGGVIVVETVFGIPGLGSGLVQAVLRGDTPTVQAIALVLGAMFIAITFVVDLLVIRLNPRLRAS